MHDDDILQRIGEEFQSMPETLTVLIPPEVLFAVVRTVQLGLDHPDNCYVESGLAFIRDALELFPPTTRGFLRDVAKEPASTPEQSDSRRDGPCDP